MLPSARGAHAGSDEWSKCCGIAGAAVAIDLDGARPSNGRALDRLPHEVPSWRLEGPDLACVAAIIQTAPMRFPARLTGLYAITPETADTETLCLQVQAVLSGGARAIQYRQKDLPPALALDQARRLQTLCARFGRPLIINDSIELMEAVGAAGVHLGREDGDPALARARVGSQALIGVSCYDRYELALAARDIADYVAFGSVFASPTKPLAVRAPLSLFTQARADGIASVAIGGIDATNAAAVFAAGADAVAVITAVFAAPDPAAAAAQIAGLAPQRSR